MRYLAGLLQDTARSAMGRVRGGTRPSGGGGNSVPSLVLLTVVAWLLVPTIWLFPQSDYIPPKDPWQQVNVIIGRASQDCRLTDRTHSSIGLMRCIIEKLQQSIDGDTLRDPEDAAGGSYEDGQPHLPEEKNP